MAPLAQILPLPRFVISEKNLPSWTMTPLYPLSETSKFVPLPRMNVGSVCSFANCNASLISSVDSVLIKYFAGPPTLKDVCSLIGTFS